MGEEALCCCHCSKGARSLCPGELRGLPMRVGSLLLGCGVKANAAMPVGLCSDAGGGFKVWRCRMQHAGGHPRAWVLGPALGGSRPQPGWVFCLKPVFTTPEQFSRLNPKQGWQDSVR